MAANEQNSVATGNGSAIADQINDTQNLLPHLESLERIIKLPVVGAAWDKSQDVYGKVKGTNRVFNWALSAAEDCVTRAVTTAAPIVNKLDRPIQYVDQTVVKGINMLEVKAPIVKETPQEIYNQAKTKVMTAVQTHIDRVTTFKAAGQQKASSLKDLAWHKANEVLGTHYGQLAVNGVDSTTALAERLLEYYFPKNESDVEEDNDKKQIAVVQNGNKALADDDMPVSADTDAVLHTVQTVGRLSNKIARRVYRNVSRQIKHMQQGNLNDYLSSLIAALKLHQYINFINSSMGTNIEQSTLSDGSGTAVTTSPSTSSAAASAAKKPAGASKSSALVKPPVSTTTTTTTGGAPSTSPKTRQNKTPSPTAQK